MPALGSVTSDQVAVGGMVVVVAFEGLVVVDCLGRVVVGCLGAADDVGKEVVLEPGSVDVVAPGPAHDAATRAPPIAKAHQ